MTRMLVVGDSVLWGQGLRDEEKISTLAAQRIAARTGGHVEVVSFAHSGAITCPATRLASLATVLERGMPLLPQPPPTFSDAGIAGDPADVASAPDAAARDAIGEVPTDAPTIAMQIRSARATLGDDVDLVLMNGGINDVGVLNLVLPYKSPSQLVGRVDGYRGYMHALLRYATESFPRARIVVLDYYPVVSAESDFAQLLRFGQAALDAARAHTRASGDLSVDAMVTATLVEEMGVGAVHGAIDIWAGVRSLMTRLSADFHSHMTDVLTQDIAKFRAEHGAIAALASTPWPADASVFAPNARLWGLAPSLRPADTIAERRHGECEAMGHRGMDSFVCDRASMGHPNSLGAIALAEAVAGAFRSLEGQ